KNRFLRVLFFRSDDPVIFARLEYFHRVGATTDITEALKDGGYNILSVHVGPTEDARKSRLELAARSQEPSGTPIDNRKLSLERALSKSHRLSDLEIEIGYPRNYAHEWSKKKIEMIPTGEVSQLQTVENWFEDLHRLVVQQHNEFKSKVYGGAEPG